MEKDTFKGYPIQIEALNEAGHLLDPADFFPQAGTAEGIPGFLFIASGGHPALDNPFLLKIEKEGALLLIESRSGAVNYRSAADSRHPVTVRPGEAILIDCSRAFLLQSAILPWYGDILLMDGNTAPYRQMLFPEKKYYSCRKNTGIAVGSQRLHTSPIGDALQENCLLTDLLTEWAKTAKKESSENMRQDAGKRGPEESADDRRLPDYLQVLRRAVLCHPEENFSLLSYENLLGISRYRLCREYKAAFGITPLQDVNAHRLESAKNRLLYSDLSIQEIAAACGFGSSTQFINLFKRKYGLTPGEFRKAD